MKYFWAIRKVKMIITDEKVTIYELANFSIHFCNYATYDIPYNLTCSDIM